MAGEKKDQNGSQFFFTLENTPELNGKHTLFGKVVGDTRYNLPKLNEYEVDKNERPVVIHRIISAEILKNPFKDIKIRHKISEDKKIDKPKDEKHKSKPAIKNTSLLSFGFEADEEDQEITAVNQVCNHKIGSSFRFKI